MKINEIVQESEIKPTKRKFKPKLTAKRIAHNKKLGLDGEDTTFMLRDPKLEVRTTPAVVAVRG